MAKKKFNKHNTNPIIGRQAKPVTLKSVADTTSKLDNNLINNIVAAGLSGQLDTTALEQFTTVSSNRQQLYTCIDSMCQDSVISAIIRTYVYNICRTNDAGKLVWCECAQNKTLEDYVNYILRQMDVDHYLPSWATCLIKYGDLYLRLFRDSDFNINVQNNRQPLTEAAKNEGVTLKIHDINDRFNYYVEMVSDPSTMFEATKYGQTAGFIEVPIALFNTPGMLGSTAIPGEDDPLINNYRVQATDVTVYQGNEFVHAYLEGDYSRTPEIISLYGNKLDYSNDLNATTYKVRRGKSLIIGAYKIWREKSLLESTILITRAVRSARLIKAQVEVNDLSDEHGTRKILQNVKNVLEAKPVLNTGANGYMGELTNPGGLVNYVYLPTKGGIGAVSLEVIGGDYDPKELTDLNEWTNKLFAHFSIPKQYFGYTEDGAGFNGGSALTLISSNFTDMVKSIQDCLIRAIEKIIRIILKGVGRLNDANENFTIKMRRPASQEDKDYRDVISSYTNNISSIQSLFSNIETKSNLLKISQGLLAPLNLDSSVLQALKDEIAKVEKQEEDEAKQQEEAAKLNEPGQTTDNQPTEDTPSGERSLDSLFPPVTEALDKTEPADAEKLPTPLELFKTIMTTKENDIK